MEIKRKWWWEAFLEGYKPAILHLKSSKEFDLLKEYPHICPFNRHHSKGCIFFQTKEQRKQYQEQMKDIQEDTYEWHYIVGKTLGFPERSVEWYSRMCELQNKIGKQPDEKKKYDVGVHWSGFCFSSHLDIVTEEVRRTWNKYNHPKAINYPLYLWTKETSYIEIPYGDFDRLTEVCEYIRKKRGLVVTSK